MVRPQHTKTFNAEKPDTYIIASILGLIKDRSQRAGGIVIGMHD